MQKIAIIGAGISGLTVAHFLKDSYDVTIFEQETTPGGLIRCRKVNGNLFHVCGGHVFNSERQDVLDWFWSNFDRENEFVKADRNSVVFMQDIGKIPYPVENHVYLMNRQLQKSFIEDMLRIAKEDVNEYSNFEEFLVYRFGTTLYKLYFKPYNEKVWRRPLNRVPISWLKGKLPMPTVQEMIFNNMNHVKEKQFVHSQFWYEKKGGSQFIADRLSKGLDIRYNTNIAKLQYVDGTWRLQGKKYDKVIFCGNIKDMMGMIDGVDVSNYVAPVEDLEYHGTTAVFCEIDKNPYSWIYQPSNTHESHRIICTGNFSGSNNNLVEKNRITATVEFTDAITHEMILENLKHMPLNPKYLDHQYNKYTYPIQDANTRSLIQTLKHKLGIYGFYFTGRFADWEYYNMDVAIGAAMDLAKKINSEE